MVLRAIRNANFEMHKERPAYFNMNCSVSFLFMFEDWVCQTCPNEYLRVQHSLTTHRVQWKTGREQTDKNISEEKSITMSTEQCLIPDLEKLTLRYLFRNDKDPKDPYNREGGEP